MTDQCTSLADDLVWGARAISEFVYGTSLHWRRIHALRVNSQIPIQRVGGRLVASRHELTAYLRGAKPRKG